MSSALLSVLPCLLPLSSVLVLACLVLLFCASSFSSQFVGSFKQSLDGTVSGHMLGCTCASALESVTVDFFLHDGFVPFVGQLQTWSQLSAALVGLDSDTIRVGASLVGRGLDSVVYGFRWLLVAFVVRMWEAPTWLLFQVHACFSPTYLSLDFGEWCLNQKNRMA